MDGAGSAFAYDIAKFKSESLTKNLRIKSVVFDIDVLIDSTSSQTTTTPIDRACLSNSPIAEPSGVSKLFSDVKSKYMNKVRERLGSSDDIPFSVDSKLGFLPSQGSIPTDGELLKRSKANVNPKVSSSRWLLKPGMGDVLDNIDRRTIQLIIIAKKSTKDFIVKQFQEQNSGIRFFEIIHLSKFTHPTSSIFADLEKRLMHPTTETLVVSSSDDILMSGKDNGNFTCRYRAENDLYGQVTTDYIATTATEIKDVVEDLNGIAFRDSVVKF